VIRLVKLLTPILVSVFLSNAALATPIVYHSPLNDGESAGVAVLPLQEEASLNLWWDPTEVALDYVVSFEASPGLALLDFVPQSSSQAFNLGAGDAGYLNVMGGGGFAFSDPIRVGTLVMLASSPGARLDVTGGEFTTSGFGLGIIEPHRVATAVPEPSTAALLASVLLVFLGMRVAAGGRRRAYPRGSGIQCPS
jgi:hypothetical protein